MTPEANNIYLSVVSDGAGYLRRLATAQRSLEQPSNPYAQRASAVYWVRVAGDIAIAQSSASRDKVPSSAAILEAAAELAGYYATHVAEVLACRAEDQARAGRATAGEGVGSTTS